MLGNLINNAVAAPGQAVQGAALVLVVMLLLAAPMLSYVWSTTRAGRERAG